MMASARFFPFPIKADRIGMVRAGRLASVTVHPSLACPCRVRIDKFEMRVKMRPSLTVAGARAKEETGSPLHEMSVCHCAECMQAHGGSLLYHPTIK